MMQSLIKTITAIVISTSVFANEINVSEPIKQCSSSTSEGVPFKYQIKEIFNGLIFADYNIDNETDRSMNRLFKELDDGSWYYRAADDDHLLELIINSSYYFKSTNLVTEAIVYDYRNPNLCAEITITKNLRYDGTAVRQHCDKEWTKRGKRDDRMFDNCVEKQLNGFNDLKEAVSKYENIPLIGNMFIDSIDQWTKRDFTDYSQIDYELRKNGEAYLNIEWELKNNDKTVRPILRRHLIYNFDPKEASYSQIEYLIERDR